MGEGTGSRDVGMDLVVEVLSVERLDRLEQVLARELELLDDVVLHKRCRGSGESLLKSRRSESISPAT